MRHRLVIFDFDGTLADSYPWFTRVINEVADRYRFRRVAEHEAHTLRSMDARTLMRHVGIPYWKMPFIVRHMRQRKSRELDQTRLFDGVDRLLRQLADAAIATALVSSNTEPNVRTILGAENANLIRYYECGTSLFGKASRFRKVLKRSGTPALEAICIGDELRDVDAAQQAGIPFGAVTWGFTTAEALIARSPMAVFRSIDEIADRLAR